MTTILLIGGNGQVGWELARTLMPLGKILVPARSQYDLAEPKSLSAIVNRACPDLIVNAAAYTSVDKAEEESDLAHVVNADAPAELAKAARRHNALLVHYSTDYVFDGKKSEPYSEDDATNPLGVYARSKLDGEEAIRVSGADYLIFRISWIYAARGKNFLKTILRLANEREEMKIVADQIGAPTWARLVAEVTALALQQDLVRRTRNEFTSDTFHLTAAGTTSWYGFANAIIKTVGEFKTTLKCQKVVPISTAEYPLPSPRPANSRLSGARLAQRYGLHMPQWEQCMHHCLAEIYSP